MRKYTGKFPHAIREVGTMVAGVLLVKTNNSAAYFLRPIDTRGRMPRCGEDIFDYKFQRAQPMTFQQDVTRFHRMLDGYALPFVEYPGYLMPPQTKLDEAERCIRKQFIQDMVRQNILPRFSERG